MPLDPTLISIVLLVLVVALLLWVVRLELRINALTKGTNKQSLELGLKEAQEQAAVFSSFKEHTEQSLKNLDARLQKSVQKVATVRFDAFGDGTSGGGQSFATAFLDQNENGVVISTLHSRERVGVFSKPIKNGTSKYELTPEEAEAIKAAKA